MATIGRDVALAALKKADWFGLSWGRHNPDGLDQWSAAAWCLIWAHGPTFFELRDELYFPRKEGLDEALDVLTQLANWAQVLGFTRRTHADETVTDTYVFNQRAVSQKAREGA